MPKVSILIPVYNRENYIAECVQSAIDQTFTDIEVVIVDNASDDSTWEICQQYAAKDSRIRIYRNEENIGPVKNWKRCADEAKGEFSKILFSDDTIEKDCIELMLKAFEKYSDSAFIFSSVMIGPSRVNYKIHYDSFIDECVMRDCIQFGVVYGIFPVSPGAVLFRTSELKENILTDIPTASPHKYASHGAGPDILIALRIISKYENAVFIKKPMTYFRQHNNSFTVANKNNEIKDSYASAIAYQLKTDNNVAWLAHIGKELIKNIINKRNKKSLTDFSKNLGSMGTLYQMAKSLAIFVLYYVAKKYLFGKLSRE